MSYSRLVNYHADSQQMENLRSRLSFGKKADDVKLRKRNSRLYSKEDESLENGAAVTSVRVFHDVLRGVHGVLILGPIRSAGSQGARVFRGVQAGELPAGSDQLRP